MTAPGIACGHLVGGDTTCRLQYGHEGEHDGSDVVVVDRNLTPINRRHVRRTRGGREMWASVREYKGKRTVFLDHGNNVIGANEGTEMIRVNRPAVKIDGRWVCRLSWLRVTPGPSSTQAQTLGGEG